MLASRLESLLARSGPDADAVVVAVVCSTQRRPLSTLAGSGVGTTGAVAMEMEAVVHARPPPPSTTHAVTTVRSEKCNNGNEPRVYVKPLGRRPENMSHMADMLVSEHRTA